MLSVNLSMVADGKSVDLFGLAAIAELAVFSSSMVSLEQQMTTAGHALNISASMPFPKGAALGNGPPPGSSLCRSADPS